MVQQRQQLRQLGTAKAIAGENAAFQTSNIAGWSTHMRHSFSLCIYVCDLQELQQQNELQLLQGQCDVQQQALTDKARALEAAQGEECSSSGWHGTAICRQQHNVQQLTNFHFFYSPVHQDLSSVTDAQQMHPVMPVFICRCMAGSCDCRTNTAAGAAATAGTAAARGDSAAAALCQRRGSGAAASQGSCSG
jgi:hypothetical protein